MHTQGMSGNSGRRYRVQQRYENFITGKSWTRVLPKIYRTRGGAEAAAARMRWVTQPGPDPSTRIDASSADVVQLEPTERAR